MKQLLIILFAIISLSSCTKTIEYHGSELENKLVLFSFSEVGKPFVAKLSHSQFSLESETSSEASLLINGAQVSYSINGGSDHLMTPQAKGMYTSNYIVSSGDVVTIKAAYPNYPSIRATARVPQQCSYHSTITEKGDSYVLLELTINDASSMNYYNISGISIFDILLKNGTQNPSEVYNYSSIDPLFKNKKKSVSNKNDITTYFDDLTFKGENRKIDIRFDYIVNQDPDTDGDQFQSSMFKQVKIDISELSYSYFAYKKSVDLYKDTQSDLFAEPTQIFSNVENGLGLLGFRTPHIVIIDNQ